MTGPYQGKVDTRGDFDNPDGPVSSLHVDIVVVFYFGDGSDGYAVDADGRCERRAVLWMRLHDDILASLSANGCRDIRWPFAPERGEVYRAHLLSHGIIDSPAILDVEAVVAEVKEILPSTIVDLAAPAPGGPIRLALDPEDCSSRLVHSSDLSEESVMAVDRKRRCACRHMPSQHVDGRAWGGQRDFHLVCFVIRES